MPFILGGVQNSTGNDITLSTAVSLVAGTGFSSFLSSAPASAVCNDCGKALVVKASALASSISPSGTAASSITSQASSKCGASFADGSTPSSVQEEGDSGSATAATNTARTSAGVASFHVPLVTIGISIIALGLGGLRVIA